MAYFWEQFTADELNKIENFKMNLNQIEDNKFISLFDRPNLYTIADKSSINLRESKDGILLQACWVLYLNKLKATLPSQDLKYKSLSQFLGEYPEFIHKNAQEQINLFHTANWMVELFKMIPAYKNKGLTIMIVPKLIEGWEAKYITGSGQKDTTISRVKIFEHEGNVKPNTRTKQTWVTEQMPAPKAKHASSKRNIKGDNSNLSRQSRPRGLRQSALRSYEEFANDMTDEDNESMSAVTMRSASIDQSVSLSMDVPPLLLRGSSMGQADEEYFLQALTLFRQGSGPVALARAHSLSLSRAVSSNSTLDLGEFRMPVIDFSITDSFAPSSPRWTFVDA